MILRQSCNRSRIRHNLHEFHYAHHNLTPSCSRASKHARFTPRHPHTQTRTFTSSPSRHKTFTGQLYDSTQQRVEREKEEQARFAAIREASKRGGASGWVVPIVLTFGVLVGFWTGSPKREKPILSSTLSLSQSLGLTAPKYNLAPSNLQAAWTDFCQIVGQENVFTDEQHLADCINADEDARNGRLSLPFCAVAPANTEQLSQLLKICHLRKIPVVTSTYNSTSSGQQVIESAIFVDVQRLFTASRVDEAAFTCTISPATRLSELQYILADRNLCFPLVTSHNALTTLRDLIESGASGANSLGFGTLSQWLLDMTVVLPDGTIVKTDSSDPLANLYIGSQGALGVVSEVNLRLIPTPEASYTSMCRFADVSTAVRAAKKIYAAGLNATSIEIGPSAMDTDSTTRTWMPQFLRTTHSAEVVEGGSADHTCTLTLRFDGGRSLIHQSIANAQALAKSLGCTRIETTRETATTPSIASSISEATQTSAEISVSISGMDDLVVTAQSALHQIDPNMRIVGYLADGTFKAAIQYNSTSNVSSRARAMKMLHDLSRRDTNEASSHTTDGLKHSDVNQRTRDDLLRNMKFALDPMCLLNCGRLVQTRRSNP